MPDCQEQAWRGQVDQAEKNSVPVQLSSRQKANGGKQQQGSGEGEGRRADLGRVIKVRAELKKECALA